MRFVDDRDQGEAGAPLPCRVLRVLLRGLSAWNLPGMMSG
jgi:hypothetical protein